jgi:sugar phosphate isomerase/epimerase
MNEAKIGVVLSSFRLSLEESLKKAAQIGIKGIQLWNVGGELDPRNMSKDKKERFTRKASSLGLTIIALCGDIGGFAEESNVKDGKKGNGETLLGEGDVPFEKYIKALKEIDYDGFFTIERETGNERVADIVKGKEFLKKLLRKREDFS